MRLMWVYDRTRGHRDKPPGATPQNHLRGTVHAESPGHRGELLRAEIPPLRCNREKSVAGVRVCVYEV